MDNKLISVIIPIYGVEKYLDECVKSVVDQTYKNIEIILVDDGSPDNCPAMCEEWAKKDARIKVIHKKNGGLSDARNAGLDIATGGYISFVDSDDYVAAEMLEVQYDAMHKCNADIVSANYYIYVESTGEIKNKKDIPNFVGDADVTYSWLYNDTKYGNHAWNKLYKKYLWENYRFPVGKLCEDAMTAPFLIDKAKVIAQVNERLYYYRVRGGSIMTDSFNLSKMDEEEAWRINYEFMEKKYTKHYIAAKDHYLQRVALLISTIPDKKRQSEFKQQYDYLYKIMKDNIGHIVFKSKLPIKQRAALIRVFIKSR